LIATPAELSAHRALVQQAYLLFGSHHYDHYDFLVTLSDILTAIRGGASSVQLRRRLRHYLTEWDKSAGNHSLLPHEFVHSWNGKFRRPADLWTANYNVPMRNSLAMGV